MKKLAVYSLPILISLLAACSGGGGGSGNNNSTISYGNMLFSNSRIQLARNGSTLDILELTGSSNVSGATVSLLVADPSIASLSSESCTLSSNSNTCPIKISAQSAGHTTITATAHYNGHQYQIAPIKIDVSSNSNLDLSMAVRGISQTIYATQVYNPVFTFTNHSNSAINIESVTITGANKLGTTLNTTGCTKVQLSAKGGSCSLIANNATLPLANTLAPLNLVLHAVNGDVYSFDMHIVAVRNYSIYCGRR
jgi:hypothetical protein